MDMKEIYDMAPWDWPAEAGKMFLNVLNDTDADFSDRLLAAEMAGDFVVINDELAKSLLTVLGNSDEAKELRASSAIALGPALEHTYFSEFDDPDDILLSEEVFQMIQASLNKIYHDNSVPKEVRRRILEASVRAPQAWHQEAVRDAYQSDTEEWRLTAVFCMSFIKGFKPQILEALKSDNPDIHYQAVYAAGNQQVEEAWPHIAQLLSSPESEDNSLILAAIDAAVNIDLPEAIAPLGDLLNSQDDEIIDAVHEALAMMEAELLDDEYEEEEDDC